VSNLKLWKAVEETEVKYTKEARKGQHKFTSITPMSQFKKATEQFKGRQKESQETLKTTEESPADVT
jgi:hypothetical protein